MTSAVAGVGTVLAEGDGASPEVFTAVAEVLTISGPELSTEEIDVTSLDSSGGFKETIAGLRDAGSVSFDVNWIKGDAQQLSIRDKIASGAAGNYKITWSDSPATVADFAAIVTGFSMNTEPNSQIQASITLKITGQVTFT
jgi:predicted secreted protein